MPQKTSQYDAITLSSANESQVFADFQKHYQASPVPPDEALANLGLFLTSKNLSRILFFQEMYRRIVETHGVIMEFGVRWGQTLTVLSALRGIYEPFNRHRKIVGFDTFAGLRGVTPQDGEASHCQEGSFGVSEGYQDYLEHLLKLHEATNPVPHLKKFELVPGDVTESLPAYLERHPETIVSLAVLDLDLYQPTKSVLQALQPHLCKGSVLVFDELCDPYFPGETLALRETLGLRDLRIQRLPMTARVSYVVIE